MEFVLALPDVTLSANGGCRSRRLVGLMGERKKLLDAHYADAVPLDLLTSDKSG